MPYKQAKGGDWLRLDHTLLRMACCDCGLVHTFELELRKEKGKKGFSIGYIVHRDDKATSQVRSKYKKNLPFRKK